MNSTNSVYNQFFKRWRNRDSQKTDLRYASTQEVANLLIIVSDIHAIVLAELDRRPVTTKETA